MILYDCDHLIRFPCTRRQFFWDGLVNLLCPEMGRVVYEVLNVMIERLLPVRPEHHVISVLVVALIVVISLNIR